LRAVADEMKNDLGLDGIGPGCRPLGKVNNAQPLINHDGQVRAGFEAK
jgi:arylsulfatase A